MPWGILCVWGILKGMSDQAGDTEIRVIALEAKIDAIYVSVEKTRKIMKWTGIITIGAIVIPIIIIPLLLPAFFAAQGVNLTNLSGL